MLISFEKGFRGARRVRSFLLLRKGSWEPRKQVNGIKLSSAECTRCKQDLQVSELQHH